MLRQGRARARLAEERATAQNDHERFYEGSSVLQVLTYRGYGAACIASLVVLACACPSPGPGRTAGSRAVASEAITAGLQIPPQISDSAFWRMVTEFSEPGGYFRSDNFVS